MQRLRTVGDAMRSCQSPGGPGEERDAQGSLHATDWTGGKGEEEEEKRGAFVAQMRHTDSE